MHSPHQSRADTRSWIYAACGHRGNELPDRAAARSHLGERCTADASAALQCTCRRRSAEDTLSWSVPIYRLTPTLGMYGVSISDFQDSACTEASKSHRHSSTYSVPCVSGKNGTPCVKCTSFASLRGSS